MRHLRDHSPNSGSIHAIHNLVEPLESQAFDNQLVLFGRADRTSDVLDLQCCAGFGYSFLFRCHRLKFLNLSAAQFGNFERLLEPPQTVESGFDYIVRIGASQ